MKILPRWQLRVERRGLWKTSKGFSDITSLGFNFIFHVLDVEVSLKLILNIIPGGESGAKMFVMKNSSQRNSLRRPSLTQRVHLSFERDLSREFIYRRTIVNYWLTLNTRNLFSCSERDLRRQKMFTFQFEWKIFELLWEQEKWKILNRTTSELWEWKIPLH